MLSSKVRQGWKQTVIETSFFTAVVIISCCRIVQNHVELAWLLPTDLCEYIAPRCAQLKE
jgi:hypothetical protein